MRYVEGQVWEYRTRRGEERSLVKIQRIEADSQTNAPIFHVSVSGLRGPHRKSLSHAPVSQKTLDLSVTRLSNDKIYFPAADEGIAEWKQANGGVYSITLAEIVEAADFNPNV